MANLIYIRSQTPIQFNGTGGDVLFTPTGLANNAAWVSAQWDRGAGAKPGNYEWRCKNSWIATPTKNRTLDLYLAQGDGTEIDGDPGASNASISVDQLSNMQRIGEVVVETANTTKMVASGICVITSRYVSVATANRGGSSLSSTAADFNFILTPIPDEIQ